MFKVSAVNAIGKGPCSDSTMYHKIAKPTESEAPVIKEPLKDTAAALKESVTLETVISGQPIPEIKWYVNLLPVYEGINHLFITVLFCDLSSSD